MSNLGTDLITRKDPRDYQIECVDSIFNYFAHKTGNPLVAMPTGTGKSLSIAMFIEKALKLYPQTRIIVATHSNVLIKQNVKELRNWWPSAPIGINSAKLKKRDYYRQVTYVSIASVYKDAKIFKHIDLVLVDEAHLVSQTESSMYMTFFADLKKENPAFKGIGFTATKYRQGQGLLTDNGFFTDICFDITSFAAFNRLLDEGYLCPLRPKKTNYQLDVSGVGIGNDGDFIKGKLQEAVDRYDVTMSALKEALDIAHDKHKWLIFASGIEHCEHIVEILTYLGVSSKSVHSKKKDEENDETLKMLADGTIRAVVNNNCLTTGFDCPDIDLIIILRPTRSTNLWVQMLGRGTRPVYAPGFNLKTIEGRLNAIKYGGKEYCLVLDFASNSEVLGPINDPVLPRKKGTKSGPAPVKTCQICGTYSHPSVKICPTCGTEFPTFVKFDVTASETELIKTALENVPKYESFKVQHITFGVHQKLGAKRSIKVTYFCGKRSFTEFLCVEHGLSEDANRSEQWARNQFEKWWRKRTNIPVPVEIEHTLKLLDMIKHATHVKVHINKKYPDIIDHCLEGTCFGTQEAVSATPQIDIGMSSTIDVRKIITDLKTQLK